MRFEINPIFHDGKPEYNLLQAYPRTLKDGTSIADFHHRGVYQTLDEAIAGADLASKHLSQEPIIVDYTN